MVCLKNKPPKLQFVINSWISHLNAVLLPGFSEKKKSNNNNNSRYIEEYALCSDNTVLISDCKSQQMSQLADFFTQDVIGKPWACQNLDPVRSCWLSYTRRNLKRPTCSLHCRDTSDSSFSGTQSCLHTEASPDAEVVTLLFGQEECWWLWGGLRLWPALAAFGSSSTDPKEAPEMSPNHSTHHTPSSARGRKGQEC